VNTLAHLSIDLYVQHDSQNDVHEFIFECPSPSAVDAFIDHVATLCQHCGENGNLRLLVNTSTSGALPVTYLLPKGHEFMARHRKRPKTRVAFLVNHKHSFFTVQLDTVFKLLCRGTRDSARYFQASQRHAATEWLAADE
jgi:hypothetical protein